MRPQSVLGERSVNPQLIGCASACVKGASKRCAKAGMDTRSTVFAPAWRSAIRRKVRKKSEQASLGTGALSLTLLREGERAEEARGEKESREY